MSDETQVTSDLAQRFSQFGDIQDVAARLRTRLDSINEENHDAAGQDDQYATSYHQNVDANTKNLSDLVDSVSKVFGTTGDNGGTVAKSFDTVDQDGADVGNALFTNDNLSTSALTPGYTGGQEMSRDLATPALRAERVEDVPSQPLERQVAPAGSTVPGDGQPAEFNRLTPLTPGQASPALPQETEGSVMGATLGVPAGRLLPTQPTTEATQPRERDVPAEPGTSYDRLAEPLDRTRSVPADGQPAQSAPDIPGAADRSVPAEPLETEGSVMGATLGVPAGRLLPTQPTQPTTETAEPRERDIPAEPGTSFERVAEPLDRTRSVPADGQPADRLSPEQAIPARPLETERTLAPAELAAPEKRLAPVETAYSEPLMAAERGVPAQPAEPARRSD